MKLSLYLLKRWFAMLGGMLVVAPVLAVQVNPDGFGEVLIYPYYTTQTNGEGNSYNSLLSVTNDTDVVKAVKLRIREGRIGDEVGSFNLLLAPHDMWTAALVPDGDSLKIITGDTSCVRPAIGAQGVTLSLPGDSAQRVREGYIEMYEMGGVTGQAAAFAGHFPNNSGYWVPKDCEQAFANAARDTTAANSGGLSGGIALMNVQTGLSFNAKATALIQFAAPGTPLGYTDPGADKPDMASAEPVSIIPGRKGELLISRWTPGTADAVSVVLMRSGFSNEYLTEPATASQTDWIVTFPTKPYYYAREWTGTGSHRVRKVSRLFGQDIASNLMACDESSAVNFDREGNCSESCKFGDDGFYGKKTYWCYTSNVMNFSYGDSDSVGVFSSQDASIAPVDYVNGEAGVGLVVNAWSCDQANRGVHCLNSPKTTVVNEDGSVLENQTRTYFGLPVVGFAAQTYINGVVSWPDGTAGRSIYGVTVPHSYGEVIQ